MLVMLWSTARWAAPCGTGEHGTGTCLPGAAVSCAAGASSRMTFQRLQRAHAVPAARRGIIEHNISEVARGRRTKEAVLEEAVAHFRGDYRAAALKSGAPLPPACTPPTLLHQVAVDGLRILHRCQSAMSGRPCRRDGGGGGALLRSESRRPGAGSRGAAWRRARCGSDPLAWCSAPSEKYVDFADNCIGH